METFRGKNILAMNSNAKNAHFVREKMHYTGKFLEWKCCVQLLQIVSLRSTCNEARASLIQPFLDNHVLTSWLDPPLSRRLD